MRAIFFWRVTSAVDLEHLAERDGIRWRWLDVDNGARAWRVPGRTKPFVVRPITDTPPVLDILAPLFAFRLCSTSRRSPAFVEDGLDAGQALAAWEKGAEQ